MKNNCIDYLASVHLVDIDTITDAQLAPANGWLGKSELARYESIARNERKRQFLAGRALLRYVLMQYLAIDARQIKLTENKRQAPSLKIKGIDPAPFFSISHSGSWVACACSATVQVGLDIERIDARRNLDAISQHTFPPDDVAWLNKQANKVSAFYSLWSTKEARFKLTQGYSIASIEHRYEFPHLAISMVLMTEQALDVTPCCELLEWEELSRALGNRAETE